MPKYMNEARIYGPHPFAFYLQRFADGAGADAGASGTEAGASEDKATDAKPDAASESKAEDKPVEEDIDTRIAKAVKAANEKFVKDYTKKQEAAKKEQERLSKLSDDERKAAEYEANKKQLEEREKELQRKELKLEMVKVLSDRKLPVEFMDFLVADDNDSTLERIKSFEKQYKKAIENAVNERLKGKAPKAGAEGSPSGGKPSRSAFFKAIYDNQVKR